MANIDTSSLQDLIGASNKTDEVAKENSTDILDGVPAPAASPAPGDGGDDGKGGKSKVPTKKDPVTKQERPLTAEELANREEAAKKRDAKRNVITNLHSQGTAARGKLSDFKLNMKHAISKRARIAAYVVANDSKFDLVARVKKNDKHNFEIVNKAPSAIKAVVITIPTKLAMLQSKDPSTMTAADMLTINERLVELAESEDGNELKSVIVKPWDELAAYIQNETEGYLHEDENIFVTYMDNKGTLYNTVRDITTSPIDRVKGSYLYLRFNTNTKAARTFAIKHSLRSKIVAPGNYIAMKRWETAPIKGSYSASDAALWRKGYLQRFCESHKTTKNGVTTDSLPIVQHLSPTSMALIKETNGTITDCAFFPFGEDFKAKAWINSDSAKNVAHWYNRTRTVDSENKSKSTSTTVNPKDIQLVVKKEKKEGKLSAVTYNLGKCPEYQFDGLTFPKISKAIGEKNMESTLEAIYSVLQSKKGSSKKGTGKARVKTYAVSGSDLAGLSLDEITSLLAGTTA